MGAKYQLVSKPIVLSPYVNVKIPTNYDDDLTRRWAREIWTSRSGCWRLGRSIPCRCMSAPRRDIECAVLQSDRLQRRNRCDPPEPALDQGLPGEQQNSQRQRPPGRTRAGTGLQRGFHQAEPHHGVAREWPALAGGLSGIGAVRRKCERRTFVGVGNILFVLIHRDEENER